MAKTTDEKIIGLCTKTGGATIGAIHTAFGFHEIYETESYVEIMLEDGLLEANEKTGKYAASQIAKDRYPAITQKQVAYFAPDRPRLIRRGVKPTYGFRWMLVGESFCVPLADHKGLTLPQLQAKIGSAAGKSAKRFKHTYATKADRDAQAILVTRTG